MDRQGKAGRAGRGPARMGTAGRGMERQERRRDAPAKEGSNTRSSGYHTTTNRNYSK